jgi:MFS family permease
MLGSGAAGNPSTPDHSMSEALPQSPESREPYPGARVAVLGLLAVLMLVPVTLPVTVLRGLIAERFAVSELLTSLFMSINMVGALVAAPIAGALADRLGRRVEVIVGALLCDCALLASLTLDVPFALFMALRFFEGCAHIVALSLLLAIASNARAAEQRGRVMGLTGAGIMLGVALGAPIGGALGSNDPLLPLYVGSAVVGLAAVIAWRLLEETGGTREERPSITQIVAELRAEPLIAAPLAFAFADRFTVGFYTTTFSLFLSGIHGFEPPQIGLHMAIFMLPFALLSAPFGWLAERGVSRVAMICSGSLVYAVCTVLVPWLPAGDLVPLMIVLGVASAVMFVPSLLITTDAAPDEIRTTAMGAFNAAGSLGFIVGPATGGLVSQFVASEHGWESGYRAAFGVAGASEALCVAIALPFLLRLVRAGRTT